MSAPAYTLRNPKVTPKLAQAQRSGCTTALPTRSKLLPPAARKNFGCNNDDVLAYAAAECIATFEKIQGECRAAGKPFFDKSFWFGDREAMYPAGTPEDCTVTEPSVIKRLGEIFPGAPLFSASTESNDIEQGAIGDCFFIGAVSALACSTAQHLNPIGRLFVGIDQELGLYGICFSKNGGFEWVIIDDYVAVDPSDGTPLYAKATDKELWPMLLEKAYAKIHFCWDTIDGGWEREALADMTGGKEFTMDLAGAEKRMTFEQFKILVDNPLIVLGCAVNQRVSGGGGAVGAAGEEGTVFGLFKGHAYSVIAASKTSDGKGFVRVRNPWGNGAEWKGAYSDGSKEWKANPVHQRELAPEFKDDGAFWITWDDFRTYFSDIDVCEFYDCSSNLVLNFGATAFAPGPSQTFIYQVGVPLSGGKPDPALATAPVATVTTVGQEDPKAQPDHKKAKSTPYATLRLSIQKLLREPTSFEELRSLADGMPKTTRRIANRQVDDETDLVPGWYSITPQFTNAREGMGFYIKAVAPANVPLVMYRLDSKATTLASAGQITTHHDDPSVIAFMEGRSAGKGNVGPAGPAKPVVAPVVAPVVTPVVTPAVRPPSGAGAGAKPVVAPVTPAPAVVTPAAGGAAKPVVAPVTPAPAVAAATTPSVAPVVVREEERVIRGSGPEHIYRAPKCRPTTAQLSVQATTFNEGTCSFIKPMRIRLPESGTVGAMHADAVRQCGEQVKKIVAACVTANKPFFDKTFYYADRFNLYPNGSPDDCTVCEPLAATRLSETMPGKPLFHEGTGTGDMTQGSVGNCFFVGAVAALASCQVDPEIKPLERLFAAFDAKWGVYGVVFFKNGSWEWVIVDDMVAWDPDNNVPLYANSTTELWPMILEKAYAKIHYCWDTIDGGWGREALADMTGGKEFTMDLAKEGTTWQQFRDLVNHQRTVVCCAVDPKAPDAGTSGSAGEAGTVFGLFKGHAYSVISGKETTDGTGFLRVRNPWGQGEWKGRYADNAPEWKSKPAHAKELNPEFKEDGAFWMLWDDFKRYMTNIDVCVFYPAQYDVVQMYGVAKSETQNTAETTFILAVESDTGGAITTSITLGQEDPKTNSNHTIAKSQPYATLRLRVSKLTRLPTSFDDLKNCLGAPVETKQLYNRQVDNKLELEPGLYSIQPRFAKAPPNVGYYIRAFAKPEATLKMYRFDKPDVVVTSGQGSAVGVKAIRQLKGGIKRGGASASHGRSDFEQHLAVSFKTSGGFQKAVDTAFSLADPWGRGAIDRRMAEQAFAQLLMHSDLGMQFATAAASARQLDSKAFAALVREVLENPDDAPVADTGAEEAA